MTGISTPIKEGPERSLAPSTLRGHREKMAIYELESGSSLDTESAGAMVLDFQPSER